MGRIPQITYQSKSQILICAVYFRHKSIHISESLTAVRIFVLMYYTLIRRFIYKLKSSGLHDWMITLITKKQRQLTRKIRECALKSYYCHFLLVCIQNILSYTLKFIQFKQQLVFLVASSRKYPSQTGLKFQLLDHLVSLMIPLPRPTSNIHYTLSTLNIT